MRLLLFSACLVTTLAFADAVDVSLNARTLMGQGEPSVSVNIQEPIAGFRLQLKRSDGKLVDIKGGGKPGQTRVLPLGQPEGKFGYVGELTVNFNNGTSSSMPLQFDAEMWGPLHMKLEKTGIDLPNRKLTFSLSRPAGKAVVKVQMDTGKYAFDGEVPFNGEPANTPLTVTWPEASGRVMKIVVQGYDTGTFFTGVEIFPWQIDIPHEEVNFASGKYDILPDEAVKLDKSLREIQTAVDKYGRFAELKLYVAGHTDTVGPKDSNRTLSLNRARAMGGYFRKRGLRIPIHFEGFGEEALLVGTNDETDEPKNRRAEYIIAVQEPTVEKSSFQPKWQRL